MTARYLIKLEPDDNDTLLVTCPALPEVATFGEDEADAVRRARDAIEEALAARIEDGMDIPAPAPRSRGRAVALPLMAARLIASTSFTRLLVIPGCANRPSAVRGWAAPPHHR
jgi:predicted RNase H-like HicB family nuclease